MAIIVKCLLKVLSSLRTNDPFMKTKEYLEWMSLAPADIPCWLAGGSLIWMWFTHSLALAFTLATIAFILSIIACYFGMPPREEFGKITNGAKRVLYPSFVVCVVIATLVIFAKQFPQYQ